MFGGNRLLRFLLLAACAASMLGAAAQSQPVFAESGPGTYTFPFIAQIRPAVVTPVIHAPFINDDSGSAVLSDHYREMSVFWFGKVNSTDNHSDVRIGYNRYVLFVDVSTIDQQLWYDQSSPPSSNFRAWDSAALFLSVPGTNGQEARNLRLEAELSHWQDRSAYQTAYHRSGSQWSQTSFTYRTDSSWSGEGLNSAPIDEGWHVIFRVPFASLGLSGPPSAGTAWKMGLKVFDKDSGSTQSTLEKSWPTGIQEMQDETYGQLVFGFPVFQKPNTPVSGRVVIKNGPNDTVQDGSVGGGTTCGNNGVDKWAVWGDRVWNRSPENEIAVIQNQQLVADWPCFSRYYITFPLDRLPKGKKILSATLTMYEFGGSDPAQAEASYIQVFRVDRAWSPSTLTWNNAPQVAENYPGAWVDPLLTYPGVPGVARTWDVSQALEDMYDTDQPLRLALYSADRAMHSGKYFRSSDTASWSTVTPPTLTIEYGE